MISWVWESSVAVDCAAVLPRLRAALRGTGVAVAFYAPPSAEEQAFSAAHGPEFGN